VNSNAPVSLSSCIPSRRAWATGFLPALWLICLTSGCSHGDGLQRNAISGTITIDGAPLKSGVVRLIPITPHTGPGAMERVSDGFFQFTEDNGPVTAEHRVEIEATDHQPFAIDDEAAFASYTKTTGRSPLARNPIPAFYNSASTLTVNVADVENQLFLFELKSRP
jgi:hypothetical protein